MNSPILIACARDTSSAAGAAEVNALRAGIAALRPGLDVAGVKGRPDTRAAPLLGPDPRLAPLLDQRLREASVTDNDAVILAAAGSADPTAAQNVKELTTTLELNDFDHAQLRLAAPLPLENALHHRRTGAFPVIDPLDGNTLATGPANNHPGDHEDERYSI